MEDVIADGAVDIVVFEVGGQRYGLAAADVDKLERAVTIVPLPRAPPIIEGVINVRGALVAVLDLRSRFRLPARPVEHTDHLVLARVDGRRVAIRADRALGLRRISPREVEDAATALPGVEYVAGVAKLDDGLVLIHDLRTFLSQAETEVLDAALPEGDAG
jgi:purine-binding chemotaxis protein CheW